MEDIEGFNGAGLYDSNTGFLDAAAQPDTNDRKKTVEYAIKKTWASYWGFEAFEERRRENVDHRSGAMGVLVHARFDDDRERDNGVATFTFAPHHADEIATVVINVQNGAVSVTNPDPTVTDLPEMIEVTVQDNGSYSIERVRQSSITDDEVFSDAAVRELVDGLHATATIWRDQVNASLNAGRQVDVVSLDFEFKTMDTGWPAGAADDDGGLILKQARSLDPGLRGVPTSVQTLPIPRDILVRSLRVDELTCAGKPVHAAWTDPLSTPDMGYSDRPFTTPITADISSCDSRTPHSTADQFLLELLGSSDRIDLTG